MKGVYAKCKDDAERNRKTSEYLDSMETFSKFFKKTLYLRLIAPPAYCSEPLIFIRDILDVLPIALKQQKYTIERKDDALERFYTQMGFLQTPGGHNSMSVADLEFILNQFDIDKTKIMLIPDISQEAARRVCLDRGGVIRLFSPFMNTVFDCCQAVNYLFIRTVMGVNWNEDKCTEHTQCHKKMKELILGHCQGRLQGKERFYNDCITIEQSARMMQEECPAKYELKRNAPDYFLSGHGAEEETFISNYNAIVKYYSIPKFRIFTRASRKDTMFIWTLRFLCRLGWVQAFFNYDESMDESDQKTIDAVLECMFDVVPEKHMAAAREFLKVALLESSTSGGSSEHDGSVNGASMEELSDLMKNELKIHVGKGQRPEPRKKKKKSYK